MRKHWIILFMLILSANIICAQEDEIVTATTVSEPTAEKAYNEGTALLQQKKYKEALAKFNEAIEHNPEFGKAYLNRATTYSDLKEYDKAVSDYTKAIGIEESTSAYFGRAQAHYELNKFDDAKNDYAKIIELDPLYAPA